MEGDGMVNLASFRDRFQILEVIEHHRARATHRRLTLGV